MVVVELKMAIFQINDPYILTNGIFIRKAGVAETSLAAAAATTVAPAPTSVPGGVEETKDENEDEDEEGLVGIEEEGNVEVVRMGGVEETKEDEDADAIAAQAAAAAAVADEEGSIDSDTE
jgi:hypothetical protein